MALTSGISARTQPTPLATIVAPLFSAAVASTRATAANAGPGVSYVPSIPPAAAAATPVTAPAPTVPDVVYTPSLIAPATIVPPAVSETVAFLAPSPVAAAIVPILRPTEPAAPPPREPVAEPTTPAQAQEPSTPTPTASTSTPPSNVAAQPSLLDLYRDATRTTEAHALAGFTLPAETIAPTQTAIVRTGAELIADAAYTLVAGAGTNRAGIGMLLDSVGAQASEESNRRTPEAKKPSALAA